MYFATSKCSAFLLRFLRHPRIIQIRGRILGRNLDKSLKSFLPCYSQSAVTSTDLPFDLYFFKLTQPQFLQFSFCTVNRKGEVRKACLRDRKPYPVPHGLRNPYRNLKSENSQESAQKPQRSCMFMNSVSGETLV